MSKFSVTPCSSEVSLLPYKIRIAETFYERHMEGGVIVGLIRE